MIWSARMIRNSGECGWVNFHKTLFSLPHNWNCTVTKCEETISVMKWNSQEILCILPKLVGMYWLRCGKSIFHIINFNFHLFFFFLLKIEWNWLLMPLLPLVHAGDQTNNIQWGFSSMSFFFWLIWFLWIVRMCYSYCYQCGMRWRNCSTMIKTYIFQYHIPFSYPHIIHGLRFFFFFFFFSLKHPFHVQIVNRLIPLK